MGSSKNIYRSAAQYADSSSANSEFFLSLLLRYLVKNPFAARYESGSRSRSPKSDSVPGREFSGPSDIVLKHRGWTPGPPTPAFVVPLSLCIPRRSNRLDLP